MNMVINDKLDALISLTAKECGNDDIEMFNNLDNSNISLNNKFYKKLRHIIDKHKHSSAIIIVKKCFVRVAVALMALMSLGFLTIMATPDLRDALFEVVIEWYEDYISIRYEPIENDTYENDTSCESSDFNSTELPKNESQPIETVVPPIKIEKVMKPTNIPKDWEEEEILNNKTIVAIEYYIGDELYLTYSQIVFQDNNKLFDSQTVVISNTLINGNEASVIEYTDKEGKAIIWTDGMYYYHVHSMILNIDALILVASSVS